MADLSSAFIVHGHSFSLISRRCTLSLPRNNTERSAVVRNSIAREPTHFNFFGCLKASQDLEYIASGQRVHPLAVLVLKYRDVTKDSGFGHGISAGLNGPAQCGSDGDFVHRRPQGLASCQPL